MEKTAKHSNVELVVMEQFRQVRALHIPVLSVKSFVPRMCQKSPKKLGVQMQYILVKRIPISIQNYKTPLSGIPFSDVFTLNKPNLLNFSKKKY